jgi:cysteine desulfurase
MSLSLVYNGRMREQATKSRIYLDHAATTPVWPQARAAMAEALALPGNPSSLHSEGREARALLEAARDHIAAVANCLPEAVVLTSGGSEALELALAPHARVLASATEHMAVLAARPDIVRLPVDVSGQLDLGALEAALKAGPALIAVQHANNETGVIQPLDEIAAIAAAHESPLLVDCVQSAGKLPLPRAAYRALSAHKMGGPMGAGALIAAPSAPLMAREGAQERGHRPGTPALAAHAGWAAALAAPSPDWSQVALRRTILEARLVAAGATIHGAAAPRLPNIISIGLPGVLATTQLMALDLEGFAVSAGAACSSGKASASHVLAAMGLGQSSAQAIRVSLAPTTTDEELDAFAAAWEAMATRLRKRAAA